jgi:membrane fusion protein, copper/silver efflux system
MKKNSKNRKERIMRVFGLVVLFYLVSACNGKDSAHEHDTYTCPMHPTVVSDKPGTCPVCGMDLVRKAQAGEEVEITDELSKLLKSPSEIVIANIKTTKGQFQTMPVSLVAQGMVTYDTRNIYTISTRVAGRIEKAFLKYPFQQISKGQKIAEIYSPELITAQRELVFLIDNDADNSALIQSAKEKLFLMGATENQVNSLIKTKNIQNTSSIYSAYDGYVIDPAQQAPSVPAMSAVDASQSSSMPGGMGGTSGKQSNNQITPGETAAGTLLREGAYVNAGQPLYKVINLKSIRIEFNVPSSQASTIKKGTRVELNFGSEHVHTATVDFIQPFFNENEEYLTVRAFTDETEDLHIGHLVEASITSNSAEALWIPKEAVLDLGLDKIVFIKANNTFKPKKITTGAQSGTMIEISQGLASSDEIAGNAQYLVDSESFIKAKK